MHKEFAEIYDVFMKHVDYKGWYKFLKSYMKNKGEVLDLGCGTGEFIYRFLKDGFSVTGVDISADMLKIAEEKIKSKNIKISSYKLIKDNIVSYSHIKKVDYVICNFDTVNYLENKKEFEKFIDKSAENLKKGGYLIFDAVTEEIFEEIFENGIFLDEEPEYTSIWRYEKLSFEKYFVEIDLFIKQKEEENLFRKYNEQHNKFIYDPQWIVKTVQSKGFEIFDVAKNPDFGESRIFFIFKKL
ncbi:class I SAM-dependent methyltransferase [Leptotrichia sp. OH3620_COT-345]|uniref:class I SAM-dependent DNA methyltransferase n=1 Tax=Leptotrichia sp. OH3620_COT-345 TaxID=2491048 RepID=UPI000F6537AC|nr:class I SAM-dependent methyltransferase [Leptotrichia sp. OH3620_COT-345]RRD40072.1 class I SAM-dependent methyltransferase [Leptotrichia sp. OH3620_COT-345]